MRVASANSSNFILSPPLTSVYELNHAKKSSMADIAQHILRYDIFYGVGAMLFTALAPRVNYWQLIPRKPPHSDQHAVSVTVTKTATVTRNPSTTTATTPNTVYATVTNQVTSVSRYIQYLTKYTHYPVDSETPCITFTHTYSSSPVATPMWNATAVNGVSPDATTTFSAPGWDTLILFSMYTITTIWLLYYFLSRPIDNDLDEFNYHKELLEFRFEAEKKKHLETIDVMKQLEPLLVKTTKENATLSLRAKATNILFQKLGVYEEGSGDPDNKTLAKMVEAKINAISALRLEMENLAKANSIHVASKSNIEKVIQERLYRGWNAQLHQKQAQVDHWRSHFTQMADEAILETERLRKETERLRKENYALNGRLEG
ncbi:hypothetical protein PTNB73_08398 [Pyrenophora teres f. teres]|nr:hypothetical protein HRS9122_05128 [Pyrenophora teres f. teres]KAE8858918.1 hypothetical protein PTNB73_08398 [Pyrenophora teres f. teres]